MKEWSNEWFDDVTYKLADFNGNVLDHHEIVSYAECGLQH